MSKNLVLPCGHMWIGTTQYLESKPRIDSVQQDSDFLVCDDFLLERNSLTEDRVKARYLDLMSCHGLHIDFSELQPTKQAILAFADKYGLLAGSEYCLVPNRDELAEKARHQKPNCDPTEPDLRYFGGSGSMYSIGGEMKMLHRGDSINTWRKEIATVAAVRRLWKIRNEPKERLELLVTAMAEHERNTDPKYKAYVLNRPVFEALLAYGSPHKILPSLMTIILNKHIKANICMHFTSWERWYDNPGPKLQLCPENLLGAIYAQLIQEISGQQFMILRCPGCGLHFEQAHGKQIYCSPRCRVRVCRNKAKNLKKEKTSDAEA